MDEVGRLDHETVVRGGEGESYVGKDAFVGMNARVNLYDAFLLSCFRMPAKALEYETGEQDEGWNR